MDIVISFDTTGSMSPCIAEVRRKVTEFCNELMSDDTRVAIISHGDYCDEAQVMSVLDFTTDKQEVIKFIRNSPNTSGGDSDECYELALHQMKQLNWQSDQRIALLIGDANPHSTNYRWDGFKVYDWILEAKELVNSGVILYPIQCLGRVSSNKFYNSLADISNVNKIELNQFKNIYPVIQAIAHKQRNTLDEYANQLQLTGQLDRNLVSIINGLSGKATKFNVSYADVDLQAVNPSRFQMLNVDNEVDIKSFVQSTGATFKVGRGFYQLSKSEMVQENKEVVLVNEAGDMFAGAKAREMIGVPLGTRGKVNTRDIPKGYKVFIQSTSPNRKLMGKTMFLYEVDYK